MLFPLVHVPFTKICYAGIEVLRSQEATAAPDKVACHYNGFCFTSKHVVAEHTLLY